MEKMILIVNEQTQGGRAEYENVSALKKAINELLDDRVLEVKVTKKAPVNSGSSCASIKD